MASTLPGTSAATVVPAPKQPPSPAAAEAAALFDPDVREVLALLQRARTATDRPAA